MPQIDSVFKNIRAAAILTNAFVAATLLGGNANERPRPREYNQLAIYVDFTIGSLTDMLLKVEYAPYMAASSFYQESDESASVAANLDTKSVNTVVHKFNATGKYRLLVPINDEVIKISVQGEGTVTGSSCAIDVGLIRNYA